MLTYGHLDTNGNESLAPSISEVLAEAEPIYEMNPIKSRDVSFPGIIHPKPKDRKSRYLVAVSAHVLVLQKLCVSKSKRSTRKSQGINAEKS